MIDQHVVSKVIETRDINEFIQKGVREFHFKDKYQDIWRWINEYVSKHGSVPSERAFKTQWGQIEVLDTAHETVSNLAEELLDQYRSDVLAEGLAEATKALNDDDTAAAVAAAAQAVGKAQAETAVLRDVDMNSSWLERFAEYKRRVADGGSQIVGYPSGFVSMDERTGGWRDEQFVLYVGEPKRGKSLYSLIAAIAANEQKNARVLYISFEMSVAEQGERLDALRANVSYKGVQRGMLNKQELDRLETAMQLRGSHTSFIISEDTSRLTTLSAVRAKAIEHNPDLIVIDGMYMMRDEHGETDERKILTNITRGTKRLCQELKIPIIGTTQVLSSKIGSGKNRQIEAHSIGYTGSFAQDADIIIGCELDYEAPNQSILRIVEARNSAKGTFIKVNWDWDTMDFREVGADLELDEHDEDLEDEWEYS